MTDRVCDYCSRPLPADCRPDRRFCRNKSTCRTNALAARRRQGFDLLRRFVVAVDSGDLATVASVADEARALVHRAA